jgi:2-aminobenzoate-CoA ligase
MFERSAHVDSFARDHLPPADQWPAMSYDGTPELRAYPKRMNCAALLVDRQARRFRDRPAIASPTETWSYGELQERVNRIANVLVRDLGLKTGNRVLIRGFNGPMTVACWMAVAKAGGVVVATMSMLRWRELTFMVEKAEIDFALCDMRLKEELDETVKRAPRLAKTLHWGAGGTLEAKMAAASTEFAPVDTAWDDVVLIAFTSGTTGQPKATMHFHRDVMAMCDTVARHVIKPKETDICCGTPPIAFTFGLGVQVAFPFWAGACTYLVEQGTPESLLKTIEERKITTLATAPTMYRALLAQLKGRDLSSLETCISAGEHLPAATWKAWHKATGIKIIDGLGSTEMIHIFITAAGDEVRVGATGKAIPGYEAAVMDEAGKPCPPNVVGRLAVRGPTGCRYLDNPERQKTYVQDGWNFTGDAYRRDEDGYYWYEARADDMIISAGYNISGPEIETVILEHPKVQECAVVGAPDPERGMIVKAFVVLKNRADAGDAMVKDIQDFVKAQMAPYKYPRAVVFVDALPKGNTGKLQRFLLRDQEAAKAKAG